MHIFYLNIDAIYRSKPSYCPTAQLEQCYQLMGSCAANRTVLSVDGLLLLQLEQCYQLMGYLCCNLTVLLVDG